MASIKIPLSILAILLCLDINTVTSKLITWSYSKGDRHSPAAPCATDCGYLRGDDYYWCYTTFHKWDYCTPGDQDSQVETLSSANDDGEPCISLCGNFAGESYTWCHVKKFGNWDRCNPKQVQVSLTVNGNLCMTDCKSDKFEKDEIFRQKGEHKGVHMNYEIIAAPWSMQDYAFYCGTTSTQEERCTPGGFSMRSAKLNGGKPNKRCDKSLCGKFGWINGNWCKSSDGESKAFDCSDSSVRKLNNAINSQHGANSDILSEEVKNLIKSFTDVQNLSHNNSRGRLSMQESAILPIGTVKKYIDFMSGLQEENVVVTVNSYSPIVRYQHTEDFSSGAVRVNFLQARLYRRHLSRYRRDLRTETIKRRLIDMGKRWIDDKGYLLAASLGGSAQPYNIVPQSAAFTYDYSGETPSRWKSHEQRLLTFLKSFTTDTAYIDWNLVLGYVPGTQRPNRYFLQYTVNDTGIVQRFDDEVMLDI